MVKLMQRPTRQPGAYYVERPDWVANPPPRPDLHPGHVRRELWVGHVWEVHDDGLTLDVRRHRSGERDEAAWADRIDYGEVMERVRSGDRAAVWRWVRRADGEVVATWVQVEPTAVGDELYAELQSLRREVDDGAE